MDREAWRAVIHGVAKSQFSSQLCPTLCEEESWLQPMGPQRVRHAKLLSANNNIIKTKLAKFVEALYIPWPKALLLVLLNLNPPLLGFVSQLSSSVVSVSLRPHGLKHARPPCSSPTPSVSSNSCPLSPFCPLIISSSVLPFSSCLQSFPASGPFQMRQFFASGGQSIGVSASASVLPMLDFSLYKVISYLLSSFSKRGNRPQVKCTVMRSEMVEPGQLPLFSDS